MTKTNFAFIFREKKKNNSRIKLDNNFVYEINRLDHALSFVLDIIANLFIFS